MFLHKPRRIPGRCEDAGTAWETKGREGCEPLGSWVEARRAVGKLGPGGERLARESFIPTGVKRQTWSCAARSVSGWGGWFTSLVLTEKHQQFADTHVMS
eukprot:612306-Prorocentrum_minimum.AAC.2